jgi:prolipoprotein diacylglyceryl transferase
VTTPVDVLALIPSPTRNVWYLGPVPIRAYALCIILGIVAAVYLTERRLRARGGPPGLVTDIAVWAVPFGIVGARIYHVITSPDAYFGPSGEFVRAFEIWNGGLGIWGAVAGGALGAWFACRQHGLPLTVFADSLAPGLAVAQAIGRLGNWFNNELYGRPTDAAWGLQVHRMNPAEGRAVELLPGTYHPTFLYEALWCLGVAALVWWADRQFRLGRGRVFALYAMAYVVGRFWIEALRIDTVNEIGGFRLNNYTSLIGFVAGLVWFGWLLRNRPGREAEVERASAAAPEPEAADPPAVEGDVEDSTTDREVTEEPAVADPDPDAPRPAEPRPAGRESPS